MTLQARQPSLIWDVPFYKRLANNDTSAAPGHQGGIVIPKALRSFFPGLYGETTKFNPTIDQRIRADLFVENHYLGTVKTRYQYQTWGGVREPESRLTDQLVKLRDLAQGGDILIFQRKIDVLDYYRLTLVRKASADFAAVDELANKKWGTLSANVSPLSNEELDEAGYLEEEREAKKFILIDENAILVETRTQRMARSIAFRSTVARIYQENCCVCSTALKSPQGYIEMDAAHIVPRSQQGTDDARNGIALCKRHHWAFDHGLFGIDSSRKIHVPKSVLVMPQNLVLQKIHGLPIKEAIELKLRAHEEAFAWHWTNILISHSTTTG